MIRNYYRRFSIIILLILIACLYSFTPPISSSDALEGFDFEINKSENPNYDKNDVETKYNDFTVTFKDRGHKMGMNLDRNLIVLGFTREKLENGEETPLEAEASGLIRIGDELIYLNGQPLVYMSFESALTKLRDAAVPFTLTFRLLCCTKSREEKS